MSVLTDYRKEKDDFFASDPQSPLTQKQQKDFKGLHYYPENPDLRFKLEIQELSEKEIVSIQTSTGEVRSYERFGTIKFSVDGVPVTLTVYRTGYGFFLPFVDSMAGKETYPAGRYLEIEAIEDKKYIVDFNMAYNPYCAYNERWSCPITPAENRLQITVKAGEMLYHK